MKSYLMNLSAIAICAMFLPIAGAEIQAINMKASIPFTFQAGRTTMTPGNYVFGFDSLPSGVTVLTFGKADRKSGRAHIIVTGPQRVSHTGVKPELKFQCFEAGCKLLMVSVADVDYHTASPSKAEPGQKQKVYTISLKPAQPLVAD